MRDECGRPAKPKGDTPLSKAPEFPTERAFVLQLSRDTGPTLQPFVGRVEHLSSGRRVRFATFEDFQAAVIELLKEAKQ
jgi:hypothetical protein